MKKTKTKAVVLWLVFIFFAFVVLEAATYLATGNFVWCSRYGGGCSSLYLYNFLQVLYVLFVCIVLANVINRSKEWASRLQKYYVKQAQNGVINRPEHFEGRFFHIILQVGIVFASFVILAMAYSILFGPIVLQ